MAYLSQQTGGLDQLMLIYKFTRRKISSFQEKTIKYNGKRSLVPKTWF